VLSRAEADDPRARLALDVYVHRLRAAIGAMTATLGGIDALAFTGGIGERSSDIRAMACERLGFLGLELDAERNRAATGESARIDRDGGAVAALMIEAREDVEIAAEVRSVLGVGG